MADSDAEVGFFQLMGTDFLIDNPQGLRVFCGNDNASGVSVDSVAKSRGKGMLCGLPQAAALSLS